jgi:hypothetical protein
LPKVCDPIAKTPVFPQVSHGTIHKNEPQAIVAIASIIRNPAILADNWGLNQPSQNPHQHFLPNEFPVGLSRISPLFDTISLPERQTYGVNDT